MKATVSVPGRFHAFELAHQLWKRGHLLELITSFPAGRAAAAGVPADRVRSLPLKECIYRGWLKLPRPVRRAFNLQHAAKDCFDRQAARRIRAGDLFIGWSGSCLRSLRRARELGAVTVVVRGSSHILFAERIISEEYRRLGLSWPGNPPKNIQKELDEYREADFIVVPSEFARRSFVEMGVPPEKVVKIVTGVDLELFRPFPKKDDLFRVVYVGSMTILKGVHHLLKAFSELNLPRSELLLIGRANKQIGPFFRRYRGSFRFIGPFPRAELAPLYSQGSVFVIMSHTEGLATVQTQAMACGLPVICTTNTGGEDIVRDGIDGFVIPVGDIETLKEKLAFLHANPAARERMGRAARERVSRGFTWDDFGDRAIAAYRRMLEDRERGSS